MSYMKSGRANRWATREFEQEAKAGRLRFLDWDDFEDEFRKDFMPLDAIRKRPFIPGIHLGGPGAFQAIKAIQSIPGCFQSSQSNLGNTLNALAILFKAVKAI